MIDLTKLGISKSKEFLDYFYSALRVKNNNPFFPAGSSRFTDQGSEAHLSDYIITDDGDQISVSWKIIQAYDGSLISIEAVPDVANPKEKWESAANDFISKILVSVLYSRKWHELSVRN
ncbi:hypothetical protein ACFLVC_03105 [Chloroflexota bacterium]